MMQDGMIYRIPCECSKVYIDETGEERIKQQSVKKSKTLLFHSPVLRPLAFQCTRASLTSTLLRIR